MLLLIYWHKQSHGRAHGRGTEMNWQEYHRGKTPTGRTRAIELYTINKALRTFIRNSTAMSQSCQNPVVGQWTHDRHSQYWNWQNCLCIGSRRQWSSNNSTGCRNRPSSPMIPLAPEVVFECIGMELIVPFHRSAFLCISSGGACNMISQSSVGVHHFCEKCGAVSGHLIFQ